METWWRILQMEERVAFERIQIGSKICITIIMFKSFFISHYFNAIFGGNHSFHLSGNIIRHTWPMGKPINTLYVLVNVPRHWLWCMHLQNTHTHILYLYLSLPLSQSATHTHTHVHAHTRKEWGKPSRETGLAYPPLKDGECFPLLHWKAFTYLSPYFG